MGEMARAHVILPKKLLDEIDALVGKRKRSEFIARELERCIHQQRLLAALEALRNEPGPDVPGWETIESTVEWVRKQREMKSDRERWLEENWYPRPSGAPPK